MWTYVRNPTSSLAHKAKRREQSWPAASQIPIDSYRPLPLHCLSIDGPTGLPRPEMSSASDSEPVAVEAIETHFHTIMTDGLEWSFQSVSRAGSVRSFHIDLNSLLQLFFTSRRRARPKPYVGPHGQNPIHPIKHGSGEEELPSPRATIMKMK